MIKKRIKKDDKGAARDNNINFLFFLMSIRHSFLHWHFNERLRGEQLPRRAQVMLEFLTLVLFFLFYFYTGEPHVLSCFQAIFASRLSALVFSHALSLVLFHFYLFHMSLALFHFYLIFSCLSFCLNFILFSVSRFV